MALNFLVTGVKMLSKAMDKKKMKDKAKKFVSGGKEEKRKKVRNIMESEGTYGDESKKKISPTKLLEIPEIPDVKPAVSGRIDFNLLSERLDNIVGMTDALGFLTETQAKQKRDELKLLELQNKKSKSKKREKKLEKKDSLLGKASKGVKKATKGPLDAMLNFLTKMALGALALFLINNADKIKNIFKTIGENLNLFSKLLRITIFELRNGFKASRQAFKLIGKGIGKILKPIAEPFKILGSKIKGVFVGIGTKIFGAMQKVIASLPGAKQVGKLLGAGKKGIDASKTAIQGAKTAITKSFNKATGGILKKGLAKAPSRLFLKIFGKKGAKIFAKSAKAFKGLKILGKSIKIPILGPIIVAVTSILSGDPIGQTLFKSIGAVIGGAIGSAGGPLGMIVGEILGEFLGSFLFEVFNGDPEGVKGKALLKKKFDQLVTGAGKYGKMFLDFVVGQVGKLGNFFKEGFGRFVKDFPTLSIPEGGGVQTTLGKVANLLGLSKESKYMENGRLVKVPNLALLTPMGMPFLLPHLKNSFFPSKDGEEKPKDMKVSRGGEETDDTSSAVISTSDNSETIADSTDTSDGGGTTAKLDEKDTSSVASTTSAISSQASYEEVASGTVILQAPSRSDFASGAGGSRQFKQAMIMYNNQKAMLNSYYKTQVKASLYKV